MASVETLCAQHPYPKLWLGIGNPDGAYRSTRHNYGKRAAALFRELFATGVWSERSGAQASCCEIFLPTGRSVMLASSQSYMNLSGQVAERLLRKSHLTPTQLLILHDDLDLPIGEIRLKFGGGCAGHNGLKNIALMLKSSDFWRLRIGIARPPTREQIVDYVLSQASKSEDAQIIAALNDFFHAVLKPWSLQESVSRGTR